MSPPRRSSVSSRAPRRRALDQPIRPTRAEVDLAALRENLAAARSLAPKLSLLAVVKANAYGHGAAQVAHVLEEEGVAFLGVALVEEGVELRNAGVKAPILVLGGSYAGGCELLIRHKLTPVVFRPEHLEGLARACPRGRRVQVHLKVDTGMGRLGVLPHELGFFLDLLAAHPPLEVDGVLSQLANADLADSAPTLAQLSRFRAVLAELEDRGLSPRWRHLSNSAGVMGTEELRAELDINLARPGLMLYGVPPAEWMRPRLPLRPVLSWKSGVIHLKRVPAGTPVSYGSTWVSPREAVIAVLPVGYADGYHRSYSNKAEVLVRGQRAKVVGRVCMDMCMADVTGLAGVEVGDEVVLLGEQGGERIAIEELAAWSQTIPYEVMCSVGARVPRVARDARL